jgi:hypothetical protein
MITHAVRIYRKQGSGGSVANPNHHPAPVAANASSLHLMEMPNQEHVQFASYSQEGKVQVWDVPSASHGGSVLTTLVDRDADTLALGTVYTDEPSLEWIPVPLRTWFWSTLSGCLIAGAIALEVAALYNAKNNGAYQLQQNVFVFVERL